MPGPPDQVLYDLSTEPLPTMGPIDGHTDDPAPGRPPDEAATRTRSAPTPAVGGARYGPLSGGWKRHVRLVDDPSTRRIASSASGRVNLPA
jgi:hypothetical protein